MLKPVHIRSRSDNAHTPSQDEALVNFRTRSFHYTAAADALIWIFGLLLLVSSVMKGLDARANLNVQPFSHQLILIGSAVAEWLIALWLMSGFRASAGRRVASLLLCVFVVYAAWRFAAHKADCGCFGALKVPPIWTALADLALLCGILWASRRRSTVSPRRTHGLRQTLFGMNRFALACAIAIAAPVAATMIWRGPKPGSSTYLDARAWIGKRCPLLDYIAPGVRGELEFNDVTILIIDSKCPFCTAYARTQEIRPRTYRLYIIDIAPAPDDSWANNITPRPKIISMPRDVSFFAETPLEVSLHRGIVVGENRPGGPDGGTLPHSSIKAGL